MTTRSRRTTTIVLAACLLVSVCVNMFAAGAWLAGYWLDRRLETSIGAVMQAYPPSLRRDVARRLFGEREVLRAAIADLRDARRHMFDLMRADPLDPAALDGAMAEVRVRTTELQALLQAALAAGLEEMPASERRKITPPGPGLGLFDGRDP